MPDVFLRDVKREQKELVQNLLFAFAETLTIEDGIIKNTQSNINKAASSKIIATIFKLLGERIGNKLITGYATLMGINKKYFGVFKSGLLTKAQSKAENRVWASLGYDPKNKNITKGAFLDNLAKDKTIERRIKGIATRAALGGISWTVFKRNVTNYINKTGKSGVLAQVLTKSAAFDSFAEVDRTLTGVYAEELGLNYFIYEGGTMKTTRPFCEERNGKVFTSSEIDAWNRLSWQGKNESSTVQISQGGYNCRHHFSPISQELAEQLRPDLIQ